MYSHACDFVAIYPSRREGTIFVCLCWRGEVDLFRYFRRVGKIDTHTERLPVRDTYTQDMVYKAVKSIANFVAAAYFRKRKRFNHRETTRSRYDYSRKGRVEVFAVS
ncbi:unnamed protein product [Ectocarpus sp. 13 AM-2016]